MFLGHVLFRLQIPFTVAHVHHGLRPESDAEWKFVEEWAQRWGAPFVSSQLTPVQYDSLGKDMSVQEKARLLRYDFFETKLKELGLNTCLTAHHLDDQAETVLMSLLVGHHGPLRMIPAENGPYVRPLLGIRKSEMAQWMAAHDLPFMEDVSNFSDKYLRNRSRTFLAESLDTVTENGSHLLVRRAESLNRQADLLREMLSLFTAPLITRSDGFLAISLKDWPLPLNDYPDLVIHHIAQKEGWTPASRTKATELLHARTGAFADTPEGRLVRGREALYLISPDSEASSFPVSITHIPGEQWVGGQLLNLSISFPPPAPPFAKNAWVMDHEQLHFPLHLRPWQQGDRMKPLGAAGSRKLSDIFTGEKWTPVQKSQALVLEDSQGIVGLVGYRIADRVKITPDSHRALMIEFL